MLLKCKCVASIAGCINLYKKKISCLFSALKRHKLTGDTSVMTYRGHGVLHTLIRCRFSPEFTTGQRFIYSGCSTGKIISECFSVSVSDRSENVPVAKLTKISVQFTMC